MTTEADHSRRDRGASVSHGGSRAAESGRFAADGAPWSERMRRGVNAALDAVARPRVRFMKRMRPAFGVCIGLGVLAGAAMGMGLTALTGLSLPVTAAIIIAAGAAVLVLGMITKLLTGREQFTFFHVGAVVVIIAILVVRATGESILPYLDVTVISLGVVQVFGRIGCQMAGCCHGRPHRWGIRYRHEHAAIGFPRSLVGVRLLPVQMIESIMLIGIVVIAAAGVIGGHAAGDACALYVMGYSAGRFVLEFMRGDDDRPYVAGFSEAQWTSLVLMLLAIGLCWRGVLSFHVWQVWVCAPVLIAAMIGAVMRRLDRNDRRGIFRAHHVIEVAEALDRLADLHRRCAPTEIPVAATSRGIRISASRRDARHESACRYCISSEDSTFTAAAAGYVAGIILRLRHGSHAADLIPGGHGVYHLLVHGPDRTGG